MTLRRNCKLLIERFFFRRAIVKKIENTANIQRKERWTEQLVLEAIVDILIQSKLLAYGLVSTK